MDKQKPDEIENELLDVEKRAHLEKQREQGYPDADANTREQEATAESAVARIPSE